MNEKETISFTEQIRIALSKPLWYKSLFQQSIGKHMCYFLALLVLITVIQFGVPVAAYLQSVGGLKELLLEHIPTFSLENGELTVDSVVDWERNGVHLIIDTSQEAYTQEQAVQEGSDMDNTMSVVYMISKTNVVCNQMLMPMEFSSFGNMTFNNQDLYQAAPFYIGMMGIIMFLYNLAAYMISALFFAGFGYLMNRALKLNLKFGQIYLIALYAKTVEVLLEAVLQVVGLSILYYVGSIVGIFITCNYMTRGMSSILKPSAMGGSDGNSDQPRFFL